MAKKEKANSAAQKQREYRARRDSDPERRAQYLEKERASWAKKKAEERWQPMSSLSDREKRSRRRKNREAQMRYRQRQSATSTLSTPPTTPSSSPQGSTTNVASASR